MKRTREKGKKWPPLDGGVVGVALGGQTPGDRGIKFQPSLDFSSASLEGKKALEAADDVLLDSRFGYLKKEAGVLRSAGAVGNEVDWRQRDGEMLTGGEDAKT